MNQAAFDAGAVVLDSAETRAVPESDGVVARRYRHGGLADRVVVRLVAEGHRAAADTEAALSGFAPDGEVAVGRRRRRSLGFPQWTLVHDRARAALALSVVPAFRKLARAAGSKPGNARDGYVELARTLERKAPSVLPTFHEQVARVFVDAGNLKFAATFFDKARAAEQAYGLSVDPARQAEVFLEFALVGAVTVKAIGDWLKDVARSGGAAVAYEQLMRLAIGRTHGGLAPWAAFPKDLARLATAAGVDPLEAQVRYLREVAAAPAIDRFPASLWKELGPALRRVLLPGSPLAARLPTGTASRWDDVDEAFVDWWLGVLHAAGALEPTRLPADWLSRFLSWAPDRYGPALTLVRWWAEARPGTPVTVDRPWFDADTLDLLVELGLPTTLADGCDLTLRGWASGQPVPASFGRPSEPRPRPLAALGAGDHKLTLWHQVRHLLSDPVFSAAAKANPVLFEARHDALTGWCSAVELGPLPVAADCLAELEQLAFSDVVASVPSAATFDLGEALAGSLQGGVLEERWWPAFDAAVAELGGEDVLVGGGWPWVVVASGRRAIALGPADERVALDLTAPKGHRLMCVRWLDGALLAGWLTGDGEEVASWSTAPKDWFEVSFNQYGEQVYPALPLAGGGVFVGGGVFRRGDRQWPEEEGFHCDGEKGWSAAGKGLVDAAGGPPPAAPPSFLAEVPEERRDQATLTWLPAGPVGLRTLDGRTWETLDGHTWTGDDRPEWVGAWPGDGRPRAICAGWRSLTLHDGAVVDALGRRSWLPAAAWWRTVPRSPGASAALRAIDAATARALLAVASDDEEATALAVGRVVPALDVPGLREGVARQVTLARSLQERLRAWREGTTTNSDDDAPEGVPTLERWHGVLGLAVTESAYDGADLLRGLRERAAFLAGVSEAGPTVALDGGIHPLHLRAVGFVLARPGLSADDRALVREVLGAWLDLPPLRVRVATWSFPDLSSPFLRTVREDGERHLREDWVVVQDDTRFVAHTDDTWSDEGPFDVTTWSVGPADPPGATLTGQHFEEPTPPEDAAWLRALLAVDLHHDWDPAAPARLAEATGLSPAAAALLLAGGPGIDQWGRNFLGEARELLGLKVKEAELARDDLRRLPRPALREVLARAAPDDPADLRRPPVERVIDAFLAVLGRQLAVPPELREAASAALDSDRVLDVVSAPESVPALVRDVPVTVTPELGLSSDGEALDAGLVVDLVQGLPWLLGHLPGADPLRDRVARVADLLLARLASPTCWLDGGGTWLDTPKAARKVLDLVGGSADGDVRSLPGLRASVDGEQLQAVLQPSAFGDDALAAARALAAKGDDDDLATAAEALALLPRLRQWRARLDAEVLPAGAWEANPAASAPALVARVAASRALSPEAAALYLQLLALPNPTKKDCCAWNGWAPKAYERAAAELVAAKLAVEARRPRAGRAHFLPGAWLDQRPVPFERWKVPLLDGTERRGQVSWPFGRMLMLTPPREAFERAWARVEGGDLPRFE